MRITGLRPTPLAVPFREDELWAYGGRRGLVSVLLELTTDEGVTGVGEAPAYPSTEIVLSVLRSIEPLVLGEDPFAIERIMKRIHLVGTWHHVKATSPAIAAVEMACWDIVGKVCGQPLVNLFGGRVRDEVDFFYYVSQKPPQEVAADGRRGSELGFSTFYLKVGADDPRDDIERVAALRDGAGPEARSRVPAPLLANEACWTRYDQLDVIRHGAADVLSVDNQMDGGLLNLKRGAGICEVAGLPVLKHSLGELGIGVYAAVHVMASTPNFTYANQSYASLLADDVLEGGPLPYQDGTLTVPDRPGIGVELDAERVERFSELYEREGERFGFHDPAALKGTPLLPKR